MNRYVLKKNPIITNVTEATIILPDKYYLTFFYTNSENKYCSRGASFSTYLYIKNFKSSNIIVLDYNSTLLKSRIFYAKDKIARNAYLNELGSTTEATTLMDNGWYYCDYSSLNKKYTIYNIEKGFFRGKPAINNDRQTLLNNISQPISTISIPNNVVEIQDYSFAAEDWVNLIIPESVTKIDRYAFTKCTSLTQLTITKFVKDISYNAFKDCINLNFIDFYPLTCTVRKSAFDGCTQLSDNTSESSIRGKVNLYCTPPQAKSMLQSADYIKNCRGNFVKKIIVNCNTRPSKVVAKNGGSTKATVTTEFTPDTGGVVWALS